MAQQNGNTGKRKKRGIALFIVEIAILAVVIVALYFYQKLNLIDTQQMDQSKVAVNDDIAGDTAAVFEGYMTIAIFGLDNREQGVYESGNSDVDLVLNINNDTKEMSMISVYRDTYLNIAGVGEEAMFRKCNAAYAEGGVEQAITMLNRNLDLDIDNYVCVDFASVSEAIDILGGVEIDVETEEEMDWLNAYVDATGETLDVDGNHVTSTGPQTLDGIQAVAYSRIRYTSGYDYKRAERQRRVLSAMLEKAKSAKLSQINELIDTVFPDIQTDLSKKDLLAMASAMIDYDMANSGGFPYEKTDMVLNDTVGSIVVPCTLDSNVTELHEQMFGEEDYTPSNTVQAYSEYIVDETGCDEDDAETDEFSDADDFTDVRDDAETDEGADTTESEENEE